MPKLCGDEARAANISSGSASDTHAVEIARDLSRQDHDPGSMIRRQAIRRRQF